MPNVQISVIDAQDTQVIASSVGVQGPAGISSFETVTGTTLTLSESSRSKIIRFTNSSNITVTVPAGLTDTFDCMFVQAGTGQVIISPASGVTVNSALSATRTAYQYAVATLIPLGTNSYVLSGEVTA